MSKKRVFWFPGYDEDKDDGFDEHLDAETKPAVWPFFLVGGVFVVAAFVMILKMRPSPKAPQPMVAAPPGSFIMANPVPVGTNFSSLPGVPTAATNAAVNTAFNTAVNTAVNTAATLNPVAAGVLNQLAPLLARGGFSLGGGGNAM